MTSRDFAFWLQGFFEITNPVEISKIQTEMIKRHLSLVFKHEIDPAMGDNVHQEELNNIHHGSNITDEERAIAMFGPKPSADHKWNMHGWYNLKNGIIKC